MPRDRFRHHSARSGFTLIELLIVLAIVGLSLAVTAPWLPGRGSGLALEAAAGEVRAALREARLTAIADGRTVAFRGDPDGGYWLDRTHRTLPQGLRIAAAAPIAFFASGGSSGGRVFVEGRGKARRELAVDAVTGHARLAP